MESPFFVTVASALVLAFSMDKSGAPLQLLEIGPNIPQFGIRIVHKKVGSLTNILYLYR